MEQVEVLNWAAPVLQDKRGDCHVANWSRRLSHAGCSSSDAVSNKRQPEQGSLSVVCAVQAALYVLVQTLSAQLSFVRGVGVEATVVCQVGIAQVLVVEGFEHVLQCHFERAKLFGETQIAHKLPVQTAHFVLARHQLAVNAQ